MYCFVPVTVQKSHSCNDDNSETYEESVSSKGSTNWKSVTKSEMSSLKESQTWELIDLPVGAGAIFCMLVYGSDPNGSFNEYKARLFVKGFSQFQGIDCSETCSPVAKLGTTRAVLRVDAEERMHFTQFAASTAFLYGDPEETIYEGCFFFNV
ncbi:putative polyprotein [Nephila pilipes]|uniref:Putative polyprotein n=1 Tax=Nephila pilipes TaxID=299642 RepID=A0A8X6PZ37_NEPPI|nr:putative polyprotein [Nephila pilipes]